MFALIGSNRLELVQGDITRQEVDAIVNAANSELAGGGGVDGAIHRGAGPVLMEELDRLYPDGCATGGAVVTSGGNLSTKYVFHAVGPIWRGGGNREPELLGKAYQTCLELAREKECKRVAFPAISTGIYGYPKDLAAELSLGTCWAFMEANACPEVVRFVLFDEGTYGAYARVLEEWLTEGTK